MCSAALAQAVEARSYLAAWSGPTLRTNERERGDESPHSFGATLRRRFRVRALLREVLASGVRSVRVDEPGSVLGLDRTREVLAKVTAKRLRVATDFQRERLRRERLRALGHVPSLRPFGVHALMIHERSNERNSEWTNVVLSVFVRAANDVHAQRSNAHIIRSFDDRTCPASTPPAAPPQGAQGIGSGLA